MKKNSRTAAQYLYLMFVASASMSSPYVWSAPLEKHSFSHLQQEQHTVQGRVTDLSGAPLEGVTVYADGTAIGTETDQNGYFTLQVPSQSILVFNYMGFQEYRQQIANNEYLNILLEESNDGQLDEIVITALGIEREEKQLGYSQQKLSGETFTDARSNNWVDNMKGKVPGMSFTSASSGPMGSTQIVLRGNRSVDANKNGALIVVDGIPINSGMSTSGTGNGYLAADSPVDFGNGMSDINPEDIESVTVLKGAGATALYGSRAANGAIMITTKSGKRSQGLGITFNSNLSVDVIQRWPDWQTQYGSGTGKVFNNAGELYYSYQASEDGPATQSNLGFGPRFNGQNYFQYDPATGTMGTERTLWQNYDNARKGFWRTGLTLTNSLSFAAGNDKGSMRASVTYLDNQWIMPNTGFERVAISTKGDYEIAKGIRLNSTLNFYNRSSDNLPSTGYNNHTISYFMILTNANNNIDWYRKMWLDEGKTRLNSPFSTYLDNPFALVHEVINSTNSNTFTGNISLDIDFTKNLKLMMRSGINSQNEFRQLKRPYDLVKFATGYYERQMINSQEINTDFLLTYKGNDTGDFNYSLSAGGNIMSNNYRRMDASANGLSVPDVYNLANASGTVHVESLDAQKKINSLYALGSFSYRNLVFLDLTARNDWSSTLAMGNNSYFYPSANLSFIMSDAFAFPLWIDFAKLRASVAGIGNDTQPYVIDAYYNVNAFPGSATVDTALSNYNLKPEKTMATEFGIDARLFGDRCGFDLAYYNTISDNQILNVPLDYATGYASQFINAGKVQNRGLEAMVYFSPVKTPNFQWRTTFTYAKNKNEILELAADIEGGEEQVLATSGTVSIIGKVGGSTGDMYGFGFVRNEEGKIIYDATTGLPVRPSTETYQGNAYADWKGGWTNNFSYKGWNLGVTLDGSFGGKLYSQSYHKMMEHGHLNESLMGREEGFIIGDGVIQNADGSYSPNTKKVAVPDYYSEYYRRANVEANTFDATWVKLREISVSYSFPKSFLDRHKLKGLTLSAFGRNLYTWSDFPIYDPETAALNGANMVPGVEMGQLPSPATYGFNLKVSL